MSGSEYKKKSVFAQQQVAQHYTLDNYILMLSKVFSDIGLDFER
jgi:hypothetical protein